MSKSYKRAMDKLELSYELKEKIINGAGFSKTAPSLRIRKVDFRRVAASAACVAVCLCCCFLLFRFRNDGIYGAVSAEIDAVQTALDFEIKYPQSIPGSFEAVSATVSQGEIARIYYENSDGELRFNVAESSDSFIKGKMPYDIFEIVKVNGIDVVLKGKQELYYYAEWSDSELSYMISSDVGLEKSVLIDMISSVG